MSLATLDCVDSVAGVYVVPLVHSPSLLSWCFEAPQTFPVFSFQFTASYGARPEGLAPHKVYLFCVTDSM